MKKKKKNKNKNKNKKKMMMKKIRQKEEKEGRKKIKERKGEEIGWRGEISSPTNFFALNLLGGFLARKLRNGF